MRNSSRYLLPRCLFALAVVSLFAGTAVAESSEKKDTAKATAKSKSKASADKSGKKTGKPPGWAVDNDCIRKDEGGAGDEPEVLEVDPRVGLHFDEARPPDYPKELEEQGVVLFKLAAVNELEYPTAAWVEASICGFEETCVTTAGDFRTFGRRGPIQPGESRYVVFETTEKVGLGTHQVTFALFDETGAVADWWVGEPIKVGYSDVRVDDILYPGHETPNEPVVAFEPGEPVSFSVVLSNLGIAPEAVVAIFSIDGGGEYTCGVELYANPVRVEPEQEGVVVSKQWLSPTRGRHILSVILKDQRNRNVYENYGIPFILQ